MVSLVPGVERAHPLVTAPGQPHELAAYGMLCRACELALLREHRDHAGRVEIADVVSTGPPHRPVACAP